MRPVMRARGQVVGVVGVEHGAFEDGRRKVARAAAVGEEVEKESGDASLGGKTDSVNCFEGMAFAGDGHVGVAVEYEARGPPGEMRSERGHRRKGSGPAFPCRQSRHPCGGIRR